LNCSPQRSAPRGFHKLVEQWLLWAMAFIGGVAKGILAWQKAFCIDSNVCRRAAAVQKSHRLE
jgi:hypothetical protein